MSVMSECEYKALLAECKNERDLTYPDAEREKKLENFLKLGMAWLNHKCDDTEINYAKDLFARALLLEYVRFCDCNAREQFEPKYRTEILDLQLTYRRSE